MFSIDPANNHIDLSLRGKDVGGPDLAPPPKRKSMEDGNDDDENSNRKKRKLVEQNPGIIKSCSICVVCVCVWYAVQSASQYAVQSTGRYVVQSTGRYVVQSTGWYVVQSSGRWAGRSLLPCQSVICSAI